MTDNESGGVDLGLILAAMTRLVESCDTVTFHRGEPPAFDTLPPAAAPPDRIGDPMAVSPPRPVRRVFTEQELGGPSEVVYATVWREGSSLFFTDPRSLLVGDTFEITWRGTDSGQPVAWNATE